MLQRTLLGQLAISQYNIYPYFYGKKLPNISKLNTLMTVIS